MARSQDAATKQLYHDSDMVMTLWNKVNALTAELDALYAKLDADAGVTDADYTSTLQAMTPKLGSTYDG